MGYRMAGAAGGIGPITVHAEELMLPVCLSLSQSAPCRCTCPRQPPQRDRTDPGPKSAKAGYLRSHAASPVFRRRPAAAGGTRRHAPASPRPKTWPRWGEPDVVIYLCHGPRAAYACRRAVGADPRPPSPPPACPAWRPCRALLTAVHAGLLDLDDIVERCYTAPRCIYGLPEQTDTWIEVDVDAGYRHGQCAERKWAGNLCGAATLWPNVRRVVLAATVYTRWGRVGNAEGRAGAFCGREAWA